MQKSAKKAQIVLFLARIALFPWLERLYREHPRQKIDSGGEKEHQKRAYSEGKKFAEDLRKKGIAKFAQNRHGKDGNQSRKKHMNAYLPPSFFKNRAFFSKVN